MKYTVEINETLTRSVVVEAESASEAQDVARGLWSDGTIVVDADDFVGVDFIVKQD